MTIKTKLIDLVNIIADNKEEKHFPKEQKVEYLLKNLSVHGKENEHIGVFDKERRDYEYLWREGQKCVLTGSEIVTGDYLLYECCGHDGTDDLRSYRTINGILWFIAMFDGDFYINEIIPIVKGKKYKYEIMKWIDDTNVLIRLYDGDDDYTYTYKLPENFHPEGEYI